VTAVSIIIAHIDQYFIIFETKSIKNSLSSFVN